jgi:Fur family ferric uptake transcriptional regulator
MQPDQVLEKILLARGLRHSAPRAVITQELLKLEGHLTAEELHRRIQRRHPRIGLATVYRTLRLLSENGLCRELRLEDGTARFEPGQAEEHHDHLICTRCGCMLEVVDPEIERLQDKLFRKHGFSPQRHHMELYGICRKCRK